MGTTISGWISEIIKQGISAEHIENMRRKKLRDKYPYKYYYDIESSGESPTLVETMKIIGIDTGWETTRRTVYNLFFSVTGEISDSETKPLHPRRIKQNLDSLISNGISYQYHFYVDNSKEDTLRGGLPKFTFFKEDDIYFSDATHRTISAMMFNAPQMIGYVTTYKKNEIKFANFNIYEQVQEKWNHFIQYELKYFDLIKTEFDEDLIIRDEEYTLIIKGFTERNLMKLIDPIIKPYKLDFEDTDRVLLLNENIEGLINRIKKIDEVYSKKTKNVLKLPFVFRCLKQFKCYGLYDLFYNMKNQKYVYISIDQSIDEIVEGIQKKIDLQIIKKNRSIKVD